MVGVPNPSSSTWADLATRTISMWEMLQAEINAKGIALPIRQNIQANGAAPWDGDGIVSTLEGTATRGQTNVGTTGAMCATIITNGVTERRYFMPWYDPHTLSCVSGSCSVFGGSPPMEMM